MAKRYSIATSITTAILVFSLWISTATAQSKTSSSSKIPWTSTNGKVLYPTGSPVINNIDTLDVSYTTSWTHTNLTLYCKTNDQLGTWALVSRPLIDQEGTFSFDPVQKNMDIPQFPVNCHIDLRNPQNGHDYVLGGAFVMTSTGGATHTFADASSSPTSVQTTASGGTDGKATGTPTPTGSTSASDTSSGGLSTGAKIGIGLGVGLGVLVAVAAAAFFIWRRTGAARRSHRPVMMPGNTESLISAYDDEDVKQPVESGGQPVYYRPELDAAPLQHGPQSPAELPSSPMNHDGQRFGR